VGSKRRRVRIEQLDLFRHGGVRRGAGRKRSGPRPLTPRDKRPAHAARLPVLVTVRLCEGLPTLRRRAEFEVIAGAVRAGSAKRGFRVVQGSVQANHLHLIVEADGTRELSSGMNGLLIRVARGLNSLWRRRGKVFADRYHARDLRTPRAVRNALVYVLQNGRKHGAWFVGVDPCSSGPWFDGWSSPIDAGARASSMAGPSPFARAETWLLGWGWKQLGLVGIGESPAAAYRVGSARARSPVRVQDGQLR